MGDLDFSLKEYMEKLEQKVDKGFDKVSLDMNAMKDSIEKMKESIDKTYAKKSSLDRLWWIFWGGLSLIGAYLGKIILDLITHRP